MGRDGPWRRPPTSYIDDEEANADGYFIFTLLDRDQNAHLDLKEVHHARIVLLEILSTDPDLGDVIGNVTEMLGAVDENNDAKVNPEEWDDFLRAVYELAGRKRFMAVLKAWRKAQLVYIQEAQAAEAARVEKVKSSASSKSSKKKKEKEEEMTPEEAATKLQARVRGQQARKSVKARKSVRPVARQGVHDVEKVKMAKAAGRHLITVISQGADHGARADFYMDGQEIEFTKVHGDHGRGLQVVTLDPNTSEVAARKVYEVFHPTTKAECARLAEDIDALPVGFFVLAANKGYGVGELNKAAVAALRSLGASFEDLGRREVSYALIGCKGCLASDEQSEAGTAMAEAMVSFEATARGLGIEGSMPRDLAP